MTIFLTIVHVLVCLFLILVVLAQQGKGQDLASAFGGGGSSAAFGARGTATLLSKITTVGAVIFMLTSLGLSYLRPAISGGTVVPDQEPPAAEAPEAPWLEEGAVPPDSEEPPGEEASPDEPATPDSEKPEAPPEPEPKTEQKPPGSD